MSTNEAKKIVILGAGVAGIRVAKRLEKSISSNEGKIILLDENDYHQYLYRIHEVCNLEYDEKDIVVPISRLIKGRRIEFIQTSVNSVNATKKVVHTDRGEISFDICVVALGSHVAYFGIEGLEENSVTLDSYIAAKKIRKKIRELFQNAEETGIPPKIVIGGGGFTGVELAGELSDCLPVLCDKHKLNDPVTWVTIVEAMPTILPRWNQKQVLKAQDILRSRGVEIILNDPIIRATVKTVELKSGIILEPDLFIWTGGVRGDPACGMDFQINSQRISIDNYCQAQGLADIYVAGDSSCTVDAVTRKPAPPTAHIAMVQGDIVANNIAASIKGSNKKKYVYKRAGEIVTLGRTNAVGELFGFKFSGWFAKIVKKMVHWWYLRSIGGFTLLVGK